MKLVLIVTGKNLLEDYKKNHLHFFAGQLSRKTQVQCVGFNYKSIKKAIIGIRRVGRTNTSTIIVPDRSKFLLLGVFFWLISQRRYMISWRLFKPENFLPKLLYYLESILIYFSSHYLYIAENQLNGVGRFSANPVFLPPVTARIRPEVDFSAGTLWCPGGADRDEFKFINEIKEKRYKIGYRTSRNLQISEDFQKIDILNGIDIVVKRFSQPTRSINSDIFLITNNFDNPAGLTTLYQNLFCGQKFYIDPQILASPLVAKNGELIVTSDMISKINNIYDTRIMEIATHET
jgi:hypothetical protein